MTLPPPTLPGPSTPAAPPAPTPPRPPLAAGHAAGWLATIGAGLLLVAASLVVTSRWTAIPDPVKALGLMVATCLIVWVGEATRRSVPTTSGIVAHLGASISTPAAIAVTAAAGGTWPVCVMVGGVTGVVVNDLQYRRRHGLLMPAAQTVATILGLAGVAALVSVPIGPLVAAAAVILLLVGCEMRATAMAALAAATPLAGIAAWWGAGPGTLARIGVTGRPLGWAAPVAGVMAAGVLLVVARRRTRPDLLVGAAVAIAGNAVVSLHAVDRSAQIDLAVLPACVLLIECIGAAMRRQGRMADWFTTSLDVIRSIAVTIATAASFALVAIVHDGRAPVTTPRLAALLLAAAGAVGWLTTDDRRWRRATVVGITSASAAFAVALSSPALAALLAGATAAVLMIHRCERHNTRDRALAIVLPTVIAMADASVSDGRIGAVLSVIVGLTLLAIGQRGRRPAVGVAGAAWSAVALMHILVAWDVATSTRHGVVFAAAVAAAGLAYVGGRSRQFVAASGALGVVGLLSALVSETPGWEVAFEGALGVGGIVLGWATGRRQVTRLGVGISMVAVARFVSIAVSWEPMAAWFVHQGVNGDDALTVAVLVATVAAGHLWGRATIGDAIAVGLPSGLVGAFIVSQQLIDRSTAWVSIGFALGLAAVVVGAQLRFRTDLVTGSCLIAATVVTSLRDRLAELPGWAWMSLGGVVLVGLAIRVERTATPKKVR